MITLIPLQKVLTSIIIIYVVTILTVATFFGITGYGSILLTVRGAFVLELVLLIFVGFWWRLLWIKFPILNKWVFPDLNGEWKVDIHWNRGNDKGFKTASAHIRQDFFRLSMELISDKSESEALMVKPKKDPESKRPMLYYIYRNESAQGIEAPEPPHKGAAILKLDLNDQNILKGNYFTDRATKGHFKLQRN